MLRVACIGAGYFARFHLEAWKRIPEVELISLCDLDSEKAQQMAQEFRVEKIYSDYKEMLAIEKPDVLDIISPPESHLEICSYTAQQGISIICQKPLAPSLEECVKLVDQVQKTGVRFMVHENFRFQPWFRKIKEMIQERKLGDQLHSLNFRFRTGDGWQKGAYMNRQPYFRQMPRLFVYETGIHYLDTFRFLGGEISSVYASLKRWNKAIVGEDTAMIHLEFKNGALGVIDANRYNESDSIDPRFTFGTCWVEGNGGRISLETDGTLNYRALGQEATVIDYPHPKQNFAGDCVYATQKHFVEAYLNNIPFETEGPDYLETLRLQEAVYESAQKGQVIKMG